MPERVPTSQEQPRKTGEVVWFRNEKSFGFIRQYEANAKDIHVHQSGIAGRSDIRTLRAGDVVEYTVSYSRIGPTAVDVVVIDRAWDRTQLARNEAQRAMRLRQAHHADQERRV